MVGLGAGACSSLVQRARDAPAHTLMRSRCDSNVDISTPTVRGDSDSKVGLHASYLSAQMKVFTCSPQS